MSFVSRLQRVFSSSSRNMGKTKPKDLPPKVTTPEGPVTLDKQGNFAIKILAKPGSKQNGITDIANEGIGIQIAAPPVEGTFR